MESRSKAIRQKCLDCCCGSAVEVRLCPVVNCALYPYRMGRTRREPNFRKNDDAVHPTCDDKSLTEA